METQEKEALNGKAVPTLEMVKTWVKRDVDAASYFLNMLRRHPEVVDMLAQELYKKALETRSDSELLDNGDK